MSRFRYGLVACLCALLVLPAAASAFPGHHSFNHRTFNHHNLNHRNFNRTYPHASRLCVNVSVGGGPVLLRPSASQVATLCGTLATSFITAQGTYFSTVTPLRQQAIALVAATRVACAMGPSVACTTARTQNLTTLVGLRVQVRTAAVAYRASIQAARHTFWTAIHALRGGAGIIPDTGTVFTPPVTLPTPL
ncbi:MAG: hypothetical protein ACR2IP_03860 [Solirubrobacteraceae bacterium]